MVIRSARKALVETMESLVLMSASLNEGTDAGDWLSGTDGDDVVLGFDGDDAIHNPVGNNLIDGGEGTDTLVIYEGRRAEYAAQSLPDGNLQLQGPGLNGEEIVYQIRNVERVEFTDQVWQLSESSDAVEAAEGDAADPGPVSVGLEIRGTSGNDWLAGTDSDDRVFALGGDDVIYNPVGSNEIDGGDGIDTLVIYEGPQFLYALTQLSDGAVQVVGPGLNNDQITYRLLGVERIEFTDGVVLLDYFSQETSEHDDLNTGESSPEDYGTPQQRGVVLAGTDGPDWLSGTDGDDTVNGLAGDDVIYNPVGNNSIDGGTGIDTLVIYEGPRSAYSIQELDRGSLLITGPGLDGRSVSYEITNVEIVEFADGLFQVPATITSVTDPIVESSQTPVDEPVTSETDADAAVILGTESNDWLSGTDGDDIIKGLGGNDVFHAPVGNNVIDGGSGFDSLVIYEGIQSEYTLLTQSDGFTRLVGPGLNAPEVTYTLSNVERVEFTDGNVVISDGNSVGESTGDENTGVGDFTPPAAVVSSRASGNGIEAFHRNGQTFLTWDENSAVVGEEYNVYRFDQQITADNITDATLLTGRWGPLGDDTSVHRLAAPGSPTHFVIDHLGTALSDDQGLFVYTTQDGQAGDHYYAVTTVINGIEQLTELASTVNAVFENVEVASPVLVDSRNDGRGLLFTQFMDYAKWNPTFQGYAYNYAVALPQDYDPSADYSLKLELHAHGEHHKFLTSTEYGWDTIQLFVDDPGADRGTTHSWWFGFSADHNYQTQTGAPIEGVVENFTQQRVLQAIDEVRDLFNIDDSRIHAVGNSMGASGALTFGIQYGDLFSGVLASQPMTNYATNPAFQNEFNYLWGTPAENLDVQLSGSHASGIQQYSADGAESVGIWEWMNHADMLSVRRGETIAYLIFGHGKQDEIIDWETQGQPFIAAAEAADVGYTALLEGDAGHGWMGFLGSEVPALAGPGQDLGAWPLQNNVSFPSVTGSTSAGGLIPADSGDDRYNLDVDWSTPWNPFGEPIIDTADRYEITLRSLGVGGVADVTPQNTQDFRPAPGREIQWEVIDAGTDSVMQSGTGIVDGQGLVTVPEVNILPSSGTRLVLNLLS